MRNLALGVLLCALTVTTAVIAADALQAASAALISHSDASVLDALEAAASADAASSGEESPAVADGTVAFKKASSSSNNSLLPRLIPLQLLLSPARFRLPQVRQCLCFRRECTRNIQVALE
jgi:hypothetical protein